MIMPFGKHAGCKIHDLPIPYIKWCLSNLKDMRQDVRAEMLKVLGVVPQLVGPSGLASSGILMLPPPKPSGAPSLPALLESWYHDMSMRFLESQEGCEAIQASYIELKKLLNIP